MANFQLDSLSLLRNGSNYDVKGSFNIAAGPPLLIPITPNIPRIDNDPNKNLEKFMTIDINGMIGNRIDFEYHNLNFESDYGAGDYLDLIAFNSANPLNPGNIEVAHVIVKDTNYPPPYKPHTKGVINPGYNHKAFSNKFGIERVEFIRTIDNPHLFSVNISCDYDTAIYNYAPYKIALEWDMSRPGLDAIVIHVRPVPMGTPIIPLEFPQTGSFLVQLDNYSYKKDGLSVIITEDDILDENSWADLDSKKMTIYIDSLYPI